MSLKKAVALFKRFQGRNPKATEILQLPAIASQPLAVVGTLKGVIYQASGDGKDYIHRFKASDRPVLAVSHDGLQAFILAGGYRFTYRGFID
jgi:hypothetical protein